MELSWLNNLTFTWRDALDIFLVTVLFYSVIVMVKQTRAVAAIYGLALLILVYFLSRKLGLNTLLWILDNFLASFFIVFIIIFQRDFRNALTAIGSHRLRIFKHFREQADHQALETIVAACQTMATQKIGALIVIERNVPLEDTTERGILIHAKLSKELLVALFWPQSPLHDGATLIRNETIIAGGCLLPLSTASPHREFGTRHRAAIGITEESDALVIVVSEERGTMRVAIGGKLTAPLDNIKLKKILISAQEKA